MPKNFFKVPSPRLKEKNMLVDDVITHDPFDASAGEYNNSVIKNLDPNAKTDKDGGLKGVMKDNLKEIITDDVFLQEKTDAVAKQMEKTIRIRNDSMYQFVMLVCAMAKIQVERVLRVPAFEANSSSVKGTKGDLAESAIFISDDTFDVNASADDLLEQNFLQKPQVSGRILLDPIFYSHLEEAYTMITTKYEQLSDTGISVFMTDKNIRTYFARFVSIRIKISGVFGGDTYYPDKTYQRLLKEQNMLFRVFAKTRHEGGEKNESTNMKMGGEMIIDKYSRSFRERYMPY